MMVGEGMLQRGMVKVSMKKGELSFDVKRQISAKEMKLKKAAIKKETVTA